MSNSITNKFLPFLPVIVCCLLLACDGPNTVSKFTDNFNERSGAWITVQLEDSTRHRIITDPLNPENRCLKLSQHPKDFFAGAKRSEYVFRPDARSGRVVRYSFKFMFPEEFFKTRKEKDWVIIQQWHDEPPTGTVWAEYQENTKPPMALLIGLKTDGAPTIEFKYGLKSNSYDQDLTVMYPERLRAGEWYTFANEILWSDLEGVGYAKPKLNDVYFVQNDVNSENKVTGQNMYNSVANYYKMGLYGNKKSQDTIYFFLDEFKYETLENR